MSSGAELNQLPRPAKFGAVPCAAATWNGAGCADVTQLRGRERSGGLPGAAATGTGAGGAVGVPPLAADRARPASESAIMAVDAASDGRVMAISIIRCQRPIWPLG